MAVMSVTRVLAVVLTCFGTVAGQIACTRPNCQNGGKCPPNPPPAPQGCRCVRGFTGFLCQTEEFEEECIEEECQNGGTCPENPPPAYQECICPVAFTGYYCEITACVGDEDCNGGTCDLRGDSTPNLCVACPDGFGGALCQHYIGVTCGTEMGFCYNGGICEQSEDLMRYICSCPDDFAGSLCNVLQNCSEANPCQNGGECVNQRCKCPAAITGVLCERVCKNDDGCMNGGTCTKLRTCKCPDGFSGLRCGIACTDDSECLNEGTCTAENSCECLDGYSGPKCDIACMNNNDCKNGGICTEESLCECQDGFTGPRCGLEECVEDNDCMNGGRCIEGECECVDDFEGWRCEVACFDNDDCGNGGTCEDGTCECTPEFAGPRCEDSPAGGAATAGIVAGVVAGVVVLLLVVIAIVLFRRHRMKTRYKKTADGSLGGKAQQLELGIRNRPHSNNYIGVHGGTPPPISVRPPSADFEPDGKEFPREQLHIMEQLGAGSFATVHKAEAEGIIKKGIMTTVAVKMLKKTATDGDKSDFEKERSMYMSLGYHPNVVTMLGYCTEQEPFFLIMEYLPNGNLQTYLRHVRTGSTEQYFELKEDEKRNFLLPSEILSFASQIANGMEFLASKDCIHRDLATRNILLGEDLQAKVSDFGLARDVQDSKQYEMKSHGRVPVRWMAPESLMDNIYTTKSDVWGFAVLLWELVTLGSHPYPGMSSREVIDRIHAGYRLPKPESCSDEIYHMMTRCWNTDPGNRPDFTELCRILDNMMADANGYLVMTDLNKDDYLYLEPNQMTRSVNTADE